MKKRIRKKLHRGEFTLYGFEMHIKCKEESDEVLDRLSDQLIELVAKYDWECYGILQQLFVFERYPKQCIDARKEEFINEVKQLPDIEDVHFHDTIDAWYGPSVECECHCDHD